MCCLYVEAAIWSHSQVNSPDLTGCEEDGMDGLLTLALSVLIGHCWGQILCLFAFLPLFFFSSGPLWHIRTRKLLCHWCRQHPRAHTRVETISVNGGTFFPGRIASPPLPLLMVYYQRRGALLAAWAAGVWQWGIPFLFIQSAVSVRSKLGPHWIGVHTLTL